MQKQGTVVRWNAERAFGFIRSPASAADVFFHIRDFRGTTPPREGLAVVFEEIHGGGKGPRATAVQAAGAQGAPAGNHGSQARGARRPETTRAGRSTARTETSAGTRRNTTPVAPAGAALAYGVFGADNATMAVVAGLLGGSLSATALATKMTTRAAVNTSPEPFSNWGLSFFEDGLVVAVVWLATQYPVAFGVALVVMVAVSVLLLVVLFKFLRAVVRRLSSFFSGSAKVA